MNKFVLTYTNGIVTIKIDASVSINSKNQRIIDAMCKTTCDKIANYIEGLDRNPKEVDHGN